MSLIFAIQVEVGKEIAVWQSLRGVLQTNQVGHFVDTIYACELAVERKGRTKFVGEVSGYIFIKLAEFVEEFPAELWHAIKNTPKVYQILKRAIPEDEFNLFYEGLSATKVIQLEVEAETEYREIATEADRSSDEISPVLMASMLAEIRLIKKLAKRAGNRVWAAIGGYSKKAVLCLRLPCDVIQSHESYASPITVALAVLYEMKRRLIPLNLSLEGRGGRTV